MSQENSSMIKWIMSLIASAFVMMAAGFFASLNSHVNDHSLMLASRGERIAHLETQVSATTAGLDKIEKKLDVLIERLKK